ncbi:hypothetical protein [Aurantimicrobium sp. MWH-Uga1]|uniref:hypothetical protein n=1 Tax=Aurantimicrobium sp. MWH-Uga1 TaxID=2079575 RepID=UPI000DED991E|nr:hypothetical protein [Aurantimicrobium sp. MWH-Uga1]AXE53949.1 hypothetical protein AURUGA1_00237 [Aurantimicrobium sp. MWH-Uga1]
MIGDENQKLIPFIEALQLKKIPLTNQQFLEPLSKEIPALGCTVLDTYIKYFREDSFAPLEIHYGYTNGFQSETEVTDIFGDVERSESTRIKGTWVVHHPENKIRDSGATKTTQTTEQNPCSECGMLLSQTGVCDYC